MNICKENSVIKPLPDDSLFMEKETIWRLPLNQEFRTFFANNNGGIPIHDGFVFNQHSYAIVRFLCILRDPNAAGVLGEYDIDVVESEIGERLTDNEDLVGMEVVPIGELFGGDYICLDFRKDINHPEVCIWFHEESDDFDPVTQKVANSFTEFLSMLKEPEED